MIETVNNLGTTWFEYFGLALFQNTIFLGLIFIILRTMKNASAKIKYIFTIIGLMKLLLPPFLPTSFVFAYPLHANFIRDLISFGPIPSSSVVESTEVAQINAFGLIFLVWIIFATGMVLIPLFLTMRLRYKLKGSIRILQDMNFGKSNVKIYKSEKIDIPLSLGFFSKRIYVPEIWEQWSPDCRDMILRHELAHIRRHDGLVRIFQNFAQALYFFHPLVWWLNWRINEYREMSCDDVSTARNHHSSMKYSQYLVDIVENIVHSRIGLISTIALLRQKNILLNRIKYQMEDVNMSRIKTGIIFTLILVLFIPLSGTYTLVNQEKNRQESALKSHKVVKTPPAAPDDTSIKFVPYDVPPEPIGGFGAISKHLVYPEKAKKAGIEGIVIVAAHINEKGKVVETFIQESLDPAGCDKAAEKAVAAVEWKPALQDDKPVAVWILIPIKFNLDK